MADCGCNPVLSFGKRTSKRASKRASKRKNPQAKKAMRLWRSGQAKDLKEGWAMVKSGRVSRKRVSRKRVSRKRVSRKRVSRKHVSRKRVSRKRVSRKRVSRKRVSRKRVSRKRSRHFGNVDGPGYLGQTSYPNGYVPYFGSSEPFVNPSEWWTPYTNRVAQLQMVMKEPMSGYNGPSN
jgi:hypothetical protein